jgi:probable DNA metabolism protein
MFRIKLDAPDDFDGWRHAVKRLVLAGISEADVSWETSVEPSSLFDGPGLSELPAPSGELRVNREFPDLARLVVCHAEARRFALLHRILRRLGSEPDLLKIASDPDVHEAQALAKRVRRERHKMHAFVRFREVEDAEGSRFVAWFEPDHHVVRLSAAFFVERFASMKWSILTPRICAHWDLKDLTFSAGAQCADAPDGDCLEEAWRVYYANIFNPARLKIAAMKREMPVRFWRNLPESTLIAPLVASAAARESALIQDAPTNEPVRAPRILRRLEMARQTETPVEGTMDDLQRRIAACRECPLWEPATQAVLGEGPREARIMFVGEQPGDREDIEGHPFVGPAGQVFDRALAAAQIDRGTTYVTNAVKHFKYEPRGKRRIHKAPNRLEIDTCGHWLRDEISLVKPRIIVAMGATALRSVTGRTLGIAASRGRILSSPLAEALLVTVHPSYILRLPDRAAQGAEFDRFVEDLSLAQHHLRSL